MKVAIAGSSVKNGTFSVTGTCTGCRGWDDSKRLGSTARFILAWGEDADFIATNDLKARVKQHAGYGTPPVERSYGLDGGKLTLDTFV